MTPIFIFVQYSLKETIQDVSLNIFKISKPFVSKSSGFNLSGKDAKTYIKIFLHICTMWIQSETCLCYLHYNMHITYNKSIILNTAVFKT